MRCLQVGLVGPGICIHLEHAEAARMIAFRAREECNHPRLGAAGLLNILIRQRHEASQLPAIDL